MAGLIDITPKRSMYVVYMYECTCVRVRARVLRMGTFVRNRLLNRSQTDLTTFSGTAWHGLGMVAVTFGTHRIKTTLMGKTPFMGDLLLMGVQCRTESLLSGPPSIDSCTRVGLQLHLGVARHYESFLDSHFNTESFLLDVFI